MLKILQRCPEIIKSHSPIRQGCIDRREMRNYRDFVKEIMIDPVEATEYLRSSLDEYSVDGNVEAILTCVQNVTAQNDINKRTRLFIMNRFRNISREEVISMLDFDLRDTVAGQQIFEEGALMEARDMIIEVLTERFVAVPSEIQESVNSIGEHKILKGLIRHAVRSPKMEDFRKILSKVLPDLNAEDITKMS